MPVENKTIVPGGIEKRKIKSINHFNDYRKNDICKWLQKRGSQIITIFYVCALIGFEIM